MKKRLNYTLIVAVAVLLALSIGCSKENENSQELLETAVTDNTNTIEVFGTIKSLEVKNIFIDFPAYVEAINVREGQKISNGEILIVLDTNDFLSAISKKENELNIAYLEKEKIEKSIYSNIKNDPQMKKLLNDLQYVEDVLEKERKEFVMKEVLYEDGAISREEFEKCKEELEELQKKTEDAKYSLEINHDIKEADLKDLNIQNEKIAIMENETKELKRKLDKSYLDSNKVISNVENGVIHDISYSQGDVISEDKKLLSITRLDSLIVEAEVPEEFIKDVTIGSRVTIYPLADNSKEYEGEVIGIDSRAIQKNGETVIPIEISIENKDEFLLPNFNVDVSIQNN